MIKEKLLAYVKAPGLATLEQTEDVYDFLVEFETMLNVYRAAYGEPIGLSVHFHIDSVGWHREFHSNRGKQNEN
jgi:hypothetical protein